MGSRGLDHIKMATPSGYMNMALLVLIIWFLIRLSLTIEAIPEYRYSVCPNTSTFTPNSTYQSNLNQLLSYLTSNSTRDTGFYNTSAGQDPGNVVYGSILCRGDVTIDMCQECVTIASKDLVEKYCSVAKVAVIWYDRCMIRYSNESFFGNMDDSPSVSISNTQDISEPVRFNQLLQVSMNNSVTRAADAPTGAKKFATEEASFTANDTLYNLVQCTPDLNSSDCDRCLRGMVARLTSCCYGRRGGNILSPSCNIRYEIYPFYELAAAPTPTPLLVPPPPSSGSDGKNKISTTLIVSIVVPLFAVVLFLSSVGYCFLRRRTKYNAIQERNEYAFYGQFSVKSDVYSFGVLILEIITGKKNSSCLQSDGAMDLLSYAWKHWMDGTILEMLDPSLGNSYSRNEVIRCIHIGLLCVEEDPVSRPTMATIVLMLSSYSVSLALPRKPAFLPQTRTNQDMPSVGIESNKSTSKSKSTTINNMSISEIFPR
ncbi:hypothetical protein FEM48_Zijuj07G0056000 [Ziziphus jujuba var. spinosa]|uniref:Gnk2-homologous domain-containing protein n=1 Tax=Ziziphus jujuba var. spinosa TaxID=714518 RepID=A0A978V2S1_ZIZJJ|nr:hypothetical protein FEM48_Zijuj07G0056000 [Ziziphus jujuba var. spinosa]